MIVQSSKQPEVLWASSERTMRYFIHTTIDDFWTAFKNDRIIEDNYKPHPYKEYRELNEEERLIYTGKEHLWVLFHKHENTNELVWQSIANEVAESFPDLAVKHGLTVDHTHEYWRKK